MEETWGATKETASKRSSKTDALVLGQSPLSLDEVHVLERLSEAIVRLGYAVASESCAFPFARPVCMHCPSTDAIA